MLSTAFCTFSVNKKCAVGKEFLGRNSLFILLDLLYRFPLDLVSNEDIECVFERLMKDPHILSHFCCIVDKQVGNRFLLVDNNVLRIVRTARTNSKHGLRESTSHCKAVLLQVRRTLVVIGGFPDNRNRREHLKLEGIACFGSSIVSTLQPNSSCRKQY